MIRAGYAVIDLKGKSLSNVAVVIKGIYDAIEATPKQILLTGIVDGTSGSDVEIKDTFCTPVVSSGDFVFNIIEAGISITVTDDDEVTVSALTISADNLPVASSSGLGVMQVGSGLSATSAGIVSVSAS